MERTWIKVGALAAALAALNAYYNWTSAAAALLCLLMLGIATVRYTNFQQTAVAAVGPELWRPVVIFAAGAVFALLTIVAAEIYLAYLFHCASEFKDYPAYKLCIRDFGPYFSRPAGQYAPGEYQIIAAINFLYKYAAKIEHFLFLPLIFLTGGLISFVLRRRAAAAPGGVPAQTPHPAGHSIGAAFAEGAMMFVSAALIVFSLFAFGSGGIVEGDPESYRASVAMLNAKAKMTKELGQLRSDVSMRTREVERLQRLLKRDVSSDNDPERRDFQTALGELAQDIRNLNSEIDKARTLGASDAELAAFQPRRIAPVKPAPEYRKVDVVDVREVLRKGRQRAAPVIEGPADPSGAWSGYQRATEEVTRYNEQDVPRYQDARDSLVYTVYTTSGLGDRDARFLADFLLSAGTQVPEGGGNILRELTAAHGPFVDARDKVACISLALAFGQWLTTEQGKSGVRNILRTYVETPAGLVASPRYLDAVRSQFPATPADRTELFDAQIKPRRAWQQQIEELMREQRRRFQEPLTRFDQTAVDAFGELLGRACAERLTFAQFQDRITRL